MLLIKYKKDVVSGLWPAYYIFFIYMEIIMSWEFVKSPSDMIELYEESGAGFDCSKFVETGWYWLQVESKRCPKNCCYDTMFHTYTPSEKILDIDGEIQELYAKIRNLEIERSVAKDKVNT